MALMNPTQPELDGAAPDDGASPDKPGSRSTPMKFLYASGDRPLDGYTIRRGIGRGGFGEVYFAESDAGKEVAMKLIRRNLDVELRGVRHCLNLKHPNLVALYDIRQDGGGDEWVIMEYVSGPGTGANSLEDVLEQHPEGMPEAEVLHWVRGIAAGVAHLHDNGIVHRDLKPGNIFLDGDPLSGGVIKIGDYGLSKFISCSRRSGQTESVGTVHYMAPEIANGRYGREIDTYALGVIFYEMLTGHVPFEGESVGEVLMKHLTAEPDLERVAEPFREIVRRALTKDPEARLRGVGELLEMLPGDGNSALEGGLGAEANAAAPNPFAAAGPTPVLDPAAPISVDQRRPPLDDDEPIYRSIVDGWTHFWDRWRASEINPVGKAILVIVGLVLMIMLAGIWVPAVVAMTVFYCVYYIIWSAFLRPSLRDRTHSVAYEPHQLATAPSSAAAATEPPSRAKRHVKAAERRRLKIGWREAAQRQQAAKPWREKTVELIGSMLIAAIFCAGLSFAAMAVLSDMTSQPTLVSWLWLTITTTLGSWAVQFTQRFGEGRFEDQAPMRVLMMVLGAGVGLVAGGLVVGSGMELPRGGDFGPGQHETLLGEFAGQPGVSVVYFAALFAGLRWWKQADATREKRLGLMSVAGCMFGAWLLHLACWYPQPAGFAVAGIVAAATQLSSPWLPPSKREALARGGVV